MNSPIAIVGTACRYPDANSPLELWENSLAQRRAFRLIPPERLRAADYFSPDRSTPDATYSVQAAVIEGYEFDRVKFKVVGSTYRAADHAHWLALDVASQALADAGFADGARLPRETTGVIIANTLTGEFSRASLMRHRWPYVRRHVHASLAEAGWETGAITEFLAALEVRYKEPFEPVGDESLAGGLSNTIAGRICNHFDLKGGGYAVDGACASSLLSVATACSSLVAGDLDVALAGGVDLSLDPFEIVGFAKVGALAAEEMRVYDARSAGFWPGEGCGFVVLMRLDDALATGARIQALIRGWGISSDGAGGITRPEEDGQMLAVRRAYQRAGFPASSVTYFEGHGTGTTVGDSTELRVLARARRESGSSTARAVVSSIKANIGHTKAAAGIAGLIRASVALQRQVLPPATACDRPHPDLLAANAPLQVLDAPRIWPADAPLRAGVSSMGFGGINAHIVLASTITERRPKLSPREHLLGRTPQDAELFVLAADSADRLAGQVREVRALAGGLSRSDLVDLAASLSRNVGAGRWRAAVVASRPAELATHLALLGSWLADNVTERIESGAAVFLSNRTVAPRVAFLFPGQGSPANLNGGLHRRRFECFDARYRDVNTPANCDGIATAIAQPAIVRASLAGLELLRLLGIEGSIAVGHSLGELTALHWAGVWDESTVLRVAAVRGRAMQELGNPTGTMASIAADARTVEPLVAGTPVVIAGINSPMQTVVAGPSDAVATVLDAAARRGFRGVRIPVSHAFHSELVAPARAPLAACLRGETLGAPMRPVVSTITGRPLSGGDDLRALLERQVTSPVRFADALQPVLREADLILEVGPGTVLSRLVGQFTDPDQRPNPPAFAIEAGGDSMTGLLAAVGAAFALGAPVRHATLFNDRYTRPFDLERKPKFFANPCEQAPTPDSDTPGPRSNGSSHRSRPAGARAASESPRAAEPPAGDASPANGLEIVRALVADRAELPIAAIQNSSRLLGDLHLNSISVGQLVADAARRLGIAPPSALTEFADATVEEVARALDELTRTGAASPSDRAAEIPAGVDSWVRPFVLEWDPVPFTASTAAEPEIAVDWDVVAGQKCPRVSALAQRLGFSFEPPADSVAGNGHRHARGVVVWLTVEAPDAQVPLLLRAASRLLSQPDQSRLVIVQHAAGASGFARTFFLESPKSRVVVVNIPADAPPESVDWIVREARAAQGCREVRYDGAGNRYEPRFRTTPVAEAGVEAPPYLTRADVLLVTGGGKGIAAECALALAKACDVRLALCGRSCADTDPELAANLKRLTAAGVRWRYLEVDVGDIRAVRTAIRGLEQEWGPVTAVLHGAGANVPKLLTALDEAAFGSTLRPKVHGLRNVLAALDHSRLRLLVAFGSIIARSGLRGEADYAFANEWLTRLTEEFQRDHPHCRCVSLEWSVWSGVGMGERLGRIESLRRQGISPITPDAGVEWCSRLINQPRPASSASTASTASSVAVVVSGRFGDQPALPYPRGELPLRRFLENPVVHYPGIELVVEISLSPATDPYVEQHVFRGERLFPAVMGLEAMAQAAMAVLGASVPPDFDDVELLRPVVVSREGETRIRLAALVRSPDSVEVLLRCEATGFQTDHFRAKCRFNGNRESIPLRDPGAAQRAVPLDIARSVYDELLFHTGRFRRLDSYQVLEARHCEAILNAESPAAWFSTYLPGDLVLGDPGARDAGIHAIQVCVPQSRILPVGVGRIRRHSSPSSAPPGPARVRATEQSRTEDSFVYDLEFIAGNGEVLESWTGLRLRMIEPLTRKSPWPPVLYGTMFQRQAELWFGNAGFSAALSCSPELPRDERTAAALGQAMRQADGIDHRPDGKPELRTTRAHPASTSTMMISSAHAGALTLGVTADGPVGCDLEPVVPRTAQQWEDLLGPERLRLARLLAEKFREDFDTSATRLWTALECAKKAGLAADTPLILESAPSPDWILFRAGRALVATHRAAIDGSTASLVAAALACPASRTIPTQPPGRNPCAPTSTDTSSASRRPTWSGTSTT